jgi:hypothetical protein
MPSNAAKSGFKPKSQTEMRVEAQKQALDKYNAEHAGTSDVVHQINESFSNSYIATTAASQSSVASGAVVASTPDASIQLKNDLRHKVLNIVRTSSTAKPVVQEAKISKPTAAHRMKTVVGSTDSPFARAPRYVRAAVPTHNLWEQKFLSDKAKAKTATKVTPEPVAKLQPNAVPQETQKPVVEMVARESAMKKVIQEPAIRQERIVDGGSPQA